MVHSLLSHHAMPSSPSCLRHLQPHARAFWPVATGFILLFPDEGVQQKPPPQADLSECARMPLSFKKVVDVHMWQ